MEPTEKLRRAVEEYKAGKAEAFNVLYEESGKYVYTCIYKVMAGNDNAQDVVNDIMQDTYVEISKSISQLEEEGKFLSWAGTIATRKCYAYLKKNKKYVLLNEEDNTFDNLADNDNIIPEEVMQDKEKQRLVKEIIETQLTEMQKLCIIAYYYNEQKQSEIAKELGIPENTVKTNLSRAKMKIKDGVLDLEKREGTKLYSIAPLMLLFFKEEVQAAEVPEEFLQNIMSAVTAATTGTGAGAVATKGIVGKIVSASLKIKIITGVVVVGVISGVAGTVYMATKDNEEPIVEIAEQEVEETEAENGYPFEIKDRYEVPEAMNVFIEVLKYGGLEFTYEGVQDFYDVRDDMEGSRIYEAAVEIPLENTVEWAEDKLKTFKEHSVRIFYVEGYGATDYSQEIALWLLIDESTALTKEEIVELFNTEVDMEIKERRQME